MEVRSALVRLRQDGDLSKRQMLNAVQKWEMLERVVDLQTLKQLREMSWSLRDRLHRIATQVELSHAEARLTEPAHR